jgi:hypothetical protein
VYRTDVEKVKNIEVYLNANVVDIETNESVKQTTSVKVARIGGKILS